jgi:hypothetical protein
MTRCAECGQPVNATDPNTYQRVQGWERKATAASRKSGSDIVLREPRQEFAHAHCIHRRKLGLSPQQESMIL